MPRTYAPELQRFSQILIDSSLTLGLLTAPPSASYGGTELNAPGYSRQPIILIETGNMCAANPSAVTFTPTAAWPLCEYFGIYDVTGTMQYWGMLVVPVCSNGSPVTIQPGAAYVDWLNNATSLLPNFGQYPFASQSIGPVDAIAAFLSQMMPVTSLPSGPLTISGLTGGVSELPTDYMTLINGASGRPGNWYPTDYVALMNGASMTLIDDKFGRPCDQNVIHRHNMLAEPQIGYLKIRRMMDATRGTSAGFTVSGPAALAF